MKRIILSYLLLLSAFATSYAQDSLAVAKTDSLAPSDAAATAVVNKTSDNAAVGQAIKLYDEGDFRQAIDVLEGEMKVQKDKGLESADLYYNLGNAYFRVNDLAHARLYYEKALLINPGDRDTRHNIEYVTTKIEDKILVADTFFLSIWFRAVQNLFSSNTWAMMAVVLFIVFIACLVLFFFSRLISVKKTAFYIGIVSLVVVIFANVFAFRQKNKIQFRDTAVIMTGSAPIVSSPDINSKELFILHAGTKVSITKEDRNWYEIEIDNGSVGWVQKDKLEMI